MVDHASLAKQEQSVEELEDLWCTLMDARDHRAVLIDHLSESQQQDRLLEDAQASRRLVHEEEFWSVHHLLRDRKSLQLSRIQLASLLIHHAITWSD